jgi:hypothetical protein
MFVVPRCTRRCAGKRSLSLPRLLVSAASSSFCCPVAKSHTRPEALAELGDERLELEHAALVLVDVLAHLVDHDEQRLVPRRTWSMASMASTTSRTLVPEPVREPARLSIQLVGSG